jgi:catechol 2,3-dioxygenase-like lactoylglutathione lyase family enzyme
MTDRAPLGALRTVIYPTGDLDASKAWWEQFLGFPAYFDEPFYVGFEVSGCELGLLPDGDPADGAHAYWKVDDVAAAFAEAIGAGAVSHTEPADVGGGIETALVRTPDGSIVGFISVPDEEQTTA